MAGTVTSAREAVRVGLAGARTFTLLVAFVWAVLLVVSLTAVWPAWRWWSAALGPSLEADRLLAGLDLAVIKELSHYDRTETFGLVRAMAVGAMALALLLNPLFAAGFIGVLIDRPSRSTVQAFLARGARHYGPFLRALLLTVAIAGAVAAIVFPISSAALEAVARSGSELSTLGAGAAAIVLATLIAAFFVAVLDVARVRLAIDESRSALRAVRSALVFVPRHLGRFAGVGLAYGVLLAALTVVVFGLKGLLPTPDSWGTIAAGALLAQALGFGRLWLRTSTLASELELVRMASVVPVVAAERPIVLQPVMVGAEDRALPD